MGRVNLFGIVMILLVINIFLYVGGVRVVEADSQNSDGYSGAEGFLSRFVDAPTTDELLQSNVSLTMRTNCTSGNDCLKDNVPSTLQDTGGSGVLTFIDAIKTIWSFVLFLINIIFTPIGLFMTLPSIVALLFGLPLLVAGILGIVFLIRSGA